MFKPALKVRLSVYLICSTEACVQTTCDGFDLNWIKKYFRNMLVSVSALALKLKGGHTKYKTTLSE